MKNPEKGIKTNNITFERTFRDTYFFGGNSKKVDAYKPTYISSFSENNLFYYSDLDALTEKFKVFKQN